MQPTPNDDVEGDPFGQALDDVLSAWSDHRDFGRPELLALHPALGAAVDDVLELAREIAVLRPTLLPRIPGYEVLGEVGRGGMGIVYRARQHGVDRVVALKVLPEAFGHDTRGRSRFLAEARGIGRVRHVNVVTIHGVVETSDIVAYAMEWVDGRSLGSLLEELAGWPRRDPVPEARFGGTDSGRLPDPAVPWFCRLGIALGRALGEVHRHGLVHRDVKPGNVLLRADGTPLLSDFGLVRSDDAGLTRTGQMLGTPAFAAPEQLRSRHEAIGPRSEVFALGATLHCALAGEVPHPGRTPLELLAAIESRRRRSLVALGLPKDLETIVARCLEPDPADRYASADAVADDLDNLLALRPVKARPLGAVARTWRLLRRNRRTVVASAATGALVLVAAVLLGLWIWNGLSLGERRAEALRQARTALLEPTHEERIEIAFSGRAIERESALQKAGERALAAYDTVVDLDADGSVSMERDVVAAGLDLLNGRAPRLSPLLRTRAPTTCAAAAAWHADGSFDVEHAELANADDRRCLGLLAFATNRVKECHAAWAPLELAGDAFVDAAAGQLHLQQGEIGKAYGRFARATKEWPEAGFLAVAMADCAVRLGDLDVAERELVRAEDRGLKDPFDTQVRVKADLRAAQGRFEEAREAYEWVIARHLADTARLHYIPMLEKIGDLGRALELRLDRIERSTDKDADPFAIVAWRGWCRMSVPQRQAEFMALWAADRNTCLLARLEGFDAGRAASTTSSQTISGAPSSEERSRALAGLTFLKELTRVFPSHSSFRRSPAALRSGVAAALSIVATVQTVPSPLTSRLARWLCTMVRSGAWLVAAAAAISSDAPGQTAHWSDLTQAFGNPPARRQQATALDPGTGDLLVYGGYGDATSTGLGDFWRWNGSTWAVISNAALPGRLEAARMVNVLSINKVLMFGGYDYAINQYANKTWLWDGSLWTDVTSPTVNPPVREMPGLVYDSVRKVVVLHGGVNAGPPYPGVLNDTWEWSPATMTWSNVTPLVPGPRRYGHGMAFDPVRNETVVHGGSPAANQISNETWSWKNGAWTLLSAAGPTLWCHAMTWDEERQAIVAHGGGNASGALGTVQEWRGSVWTPLQVTSVSAPAARSYIASVFDPLRNGLIMFGGYLVGSSSSQETWMLTSEHQPRVATSGPGCNPAAASIPTLERTLGTGPWVGDTLTLEAHDLPSPVSLLILGLSNPATPLGVLGAPTCTLLANPDILVAISGTPATWTLAPVSGGYGSQFWAQTVSLDLAAPFAAPGFISAMSNGLELTLGDH